MTAFERDKVKAQILNKGLGAHIYDFGMKCYHRLMASREAVKQVIVMHGESGSGKSFHVRALADLLVYAQSEPSSHQ